MKYRRIFIFLLCLLFITGCQKSEKFADIFFNSNCVLPCWNGLDPRITTEADLQNWLDSYVQIDSSEISRIEDHGPFNAIYVLHFRDFEVGSTLFYKNSELYAMSMGGKLDISIQGLIKEFGEPESIIVIHIVRPGKVFGDVFVDVVNLLFPKSGIIATFWSNDVNRLNVHGNDSIEQLLLTDAGNFTNSLKLIVTPEFISMDIYNWEGYGSYPK